MNKRNDDTTTIDQCDANLSELGGNRVYLDFYGLKEPPFSITPDPEFLFLSNTHKSVIDKVLYGIDNRMGFILLVGEVGTGKTTICRSTLDRLDGNAESVYLINPSVSGRELISGILDDLGISYPSDSSKKELIDHLNHFLLSVADKTPVVIIIDDAQTMSTDALEDLRLLSNLETDKQKLLQMVLVGQPELLALMGQTEMRQLRQRVAINCRLEFLAKEEIDGYITRRLFIAGDRGRVRFTRKAINLIAEASKGIPRLINKICDYALTAGYIADDFVIGPKYIKKALKELGNLDFNKDPARDIKPYRMKSRRRNLIFSSAVCLMVFFLILFSGQLSNFDMSGTRRDHKPRPDLGAHPAKVETAIPDWEADIASSQKTAGETDALPGPITKEVPVSADSEPSPYILLLGSYRTLFNAKRSVYHYQNKGIEAHWNYVDLDHEGVWYRTFTRGFKTIAEAKQYKKENGLEESIIISAPWTVFVGRCSALEDRYEVQSVLRDNGYDYYSEKCEDGGSRLLIGAFKTQGGAEKLAQEVTKLDLTTKAGLR